MYGLCVCVCMVFELISVVSVQVGEVCYNLLIVLPREDCHPGWEMVSVSAPQLSMIQD